MKPELQSEAIEYASEIDRCMALLKTSLEDNDVVSARSATKALKHAADALHLLLATGKSMRQP